MCLGQDIGNDVTHVNGHDDVGEDVACGTQQVPQSGGGASSAACQKVSVTRCQNRTPSSTHMPHKISFEPADGA